jgi:multimeric flavodoxin WrbA
MLMLGLQGSPRKKGNTDFLLSTFLQAAETRGARTRAIHVMERNILPCKEYLVCEKKGYCPIDDDMASEIYGLLRQAEVVVLASPIFFYNMTSQLKALVDRCQTFWARKYRLKLRDPSEDAPGIPAQRRGHESRTSSRAAADSQVLFDDRRAL